MLCGFDLDGLALLAKERHAELLAAAGQRQQLYRMLPRQANKHNIWQWLRWLVLGRRPQTEPLDACASPHSLLQS